MKLLDRLFGGGPARGAAKDDDAIARAIIDRAVDATDKRLKLVPGYERALRGPALATLEHLRGVLRAIPGPVDLSAGAWRDDRRLRPLFARPDDIAAAFSRDAAVRSCLGASPAPHCFALLGLERSNRQVFAPALVDGKVQGEVARTVVSFGKPRILAPGTEERAVRIETGKLAVDYLARLALAQMTSDQDQKRELEQERALLRMRLQLAERSQRGLATGFSEAAKSVAPPPDRAGLERELRANEQALSKLASTELMTRFLDILRSTLADPAAHIRIDPCAIAVDDMNFVVTDAERAAGVEAIELQLQELRLGARGPWTALVARFPRDELRPDDAIANAERYLQF
jgi:hypothetical protein